MLLAAALTQSVAGVKCADVCGSSGSSGAEEEYRVHLMFLPFA